jgi:hypothetical protein
LAGIAKNIGKTAVAFEASIAVFDADASFGESGIGLFLLLSQFIVGFPFLFAFPFEGNDDVCIAKRDLGTARATPVDGLQAASFVSQRGEKPLQEAEAALIDKT